MFTVGAFLVWVARVALPRALGVVVAVAADFFAVVFAVVLAVFFAVVLAGDLLVVLAAAVFLATAFLAGLFFAAVFVAATGAFVAALFAGLGLATFLAAALAGVALAGVALAGVALAGVALAGVALAADVEALVFVATGAPCAAEPREPLTARPADLATEAAVFAALLATFEAACFTAAVADLRLELVRDGAAVGAAFLAAARDALAGDVRAVASVSTAGFFAAIWPSVAHAVDPDKWGRQ